MYRVVKLSGQYYAREINDLYDEDELVDIDTFVLEGSPVILVDVLEELGEFNISEDEIKIV